MEKFDIHEIIKNKDEQKLRELLINLLEGLIKGDEDKDEISYFPDFLVTIPLDMRLKKPYHVKDKILDEALTTVTNFEGYSEAESKKEAKLLLVKLIEKSKRKSYLSKSRKYKDETKK